MRRDLESPAEGHRSVRPLGEDHARSCRECGCEAEDQRADGGAGDDVEAPVEQVRDLLSEALRQSGVLEHAELLNEQIRVTAGGELEVTVQDGALLLHDLEHLGRVHRSSSAIARAAAAGSEARGDRTADDDQVGSGVHRVARRERSLLIAGVGIRPA